MTTLGEPGLRLSLTPSSSVRDFKHRALTRTISMVRMVTVQATAARNTRPIATKGCMAKV
jgi:hypothetical protein